VGVVISFQTGEHGFVRDAGGTYTVVDAPGAVQTDAYGINKAGHIVGGFRDPNGTHGFLAGP
jgi:uncharacterized membrane protein